MREIFKPFYPVFYRVIKWYYRKPRLITKRGIDFVLNPSVFHPSLYHSTDILLDYFLTIRSEEGAVLELGCGNGFISLYLALKTKMKVHASDINAAAIEGVAYNAKRLDVDIETYHSNLFDALPDVTFFDFILINPPYFNKEVKSDDEYAFYTDSDFTYFKKLFKQLSNKNLKNTKVLMILSEDVDLKQLSDLASVQGFIFNEVFRKDKHEEDFIIYTIE